MGDIVPVIIGFGNSNWDGLATLASVSTTDYARWVSGVLPTTDMPYSAKAPGVQVFQLRLPYAAATTRDITAVPSTTTFTMTSGVAGTTVDQWCYVLENSTGQGQLRKISLNPATATPTVSAAFSPALAVDGQVMILGSSHTTSGSSTTTVVGGQDRTVITKTGSTGNFTSAMVGKWLIGIAGSNISVARRIVEFISTTVVHTERFPSNFSGGDGIRVLDGANAVNGIGDISTTTGAFRDFEFYYDNATSYSTGFEYPNHKSAPKTSPSAHNNSRLTNILPELCYQMRQKFKVPLRVISLGAAASTISPLYTGTSLATEFSWARDVQHLDYHPSSPSSLYTVLTSMIRAGCDTIKAAGDTPDVLGIFGVFSENDAADAYRSKSFYENVSLLRDSLRTFIDVNGYSKRKPAEIPFVVTNSKVGTNSYVSVVNAALAQAATVDSRTKVIDIDAATFTSGLHFDATYDTVLGEKMFSLWDGVYNNDNYALRSLSNLPTLLSLRTKIRRRFERTSSANDSLSAQIDSFLNDSLREIYNTLGDSAWFLRRAEVATIEPGLYPATISLDGHIARPLRIESGSNPGKAIVWKGISHTTALRTQITLHEAASGPFIVHFIQIPQELVSDTDIAVIPDQYIELPVLLTCKRLAECVGNAQLSTYYSIECERLWKYVRRDCHRYDRMRQESMTTTDAYSSLRNGLSNTPLWNL